jgi:Sulfotransferase family
MGRDAIAIRGLAYILAVARRPEPRPDWVMAVNRGDVIPIAEEASLPLTRDGLLGEARARIGMVAPGPDGGIADFGDDHFLEPLDVLVPALEEEAQLTLLGRWITRRFLLRILEVRLQMTAYVRADPGVLDEEIREPLFVAGAPRTGTTILYALLVEDRAHRAPRGWELLRPVPPPAPDPDAFAADARIPLADRELRLPAIVVDGLDAIHVYGGRQPKEDLSSMSFEFRSEEFTTRYNVPSYIDWLARCDMRPAYDTHKLVLQILQRRFTDVQWILKSPVHMRSLPTLLAVYPDARIAVTHRDPLRILPSLTSLVAALRYAHSDAVDFGEIGRYQSELWHGNLEQLVTLTDDGTLDPARVYHGQYADFLVDPLRAMHALYDHLGMQLTPDAERAMRDHLAAHPQGEHGTHSYSFADLDLDAAEQRTKFARYQERFAVPSEG